MFTLYKMVIRKKAPSPAFNGGQEGGPWSRVEDLHLIERDPISLALYIIFIEWPTLSIVSIISKLAHKANTVEIYLIRKSRLRRLLFFLLFLSLGCSNICIKYYCYT